MGMLHNDGSRTTYFLRGHMLLLSKPLAGPQYSWDHSHSDSWHLYHVQILATDPYLTSSTETQPGSDS